MKVPDDFPPLSAEILKGLVSHLDTDQEITLDAPRGLFNTICGIIDLLKEARESVAEHEQLFDLQWRRSSEAIKRWQAAHPGNDHVWPDYGDNLHWLMEEIVRLEAEVADLTRGHHREADGRNMGTP